MKILLAGAACSLAMPLVAQPAEPSSREGFFVGASVGGVGLTAGPIGRIEQASPEEATAGRLRLGYWFSRHWGVEAGYTQWSTVEQSYVDGVFRGKGRSLHVSGLGRLFLPNPRWAVIGKLTLAANKLSDDGSSGSTAGFDRLRGSSASVIIPGLGLEYAINDRLAVTLEIEALGHAGKEAGLHYAGVGLRWSF